MIDVQVCRWEDSAGLECSKLTSDFSSVRACGLAVCVHCSPSGEGPFSHPHVCFEEYVWEVREAL